MLNGREATRSWLSKFAHDILMPSWYTYINQSREKKKRKEIVTPNAYYYQEILSYQESIVHFTKGTNKILFFQQNFVTTLRYEKVFISKHELSRKMYACNPNPLNFIPDDRLENFQTTQPCIFSNFYFRVNPTDEKIGSSNVSH